MSMRVCAYFGHLKHGATRRVPYAGYSTGRGGHVRAALPVRRFLGEKYRFNLLTFPGLLAQVYGYTGSWK